MEVKNQNLANQGNAYVPIGNVNSFKIIESTLRALDEFGVDCIELTSPAASEQSRKDAEAICRLGLKAKILTHVRCDLRDVQIAIDTGVDGLDIVIGTSEHLKKHSHGKDMAFIREKAVEVIRYVKSRGIEARFSCEDSFRSNFGDMLTLYAAVDQAGCDRVGIADTVGCANPRQVFDLVRTLRSVVSCDIETHFHNDTDCSTANAFCALEAGATHIDTSVLGIGERNGITPLGSLMARMVVTCPDYVKSKYNIKMIKTVENLVAEAVAVKIPFNNPITGFCSFTHKAGIHAKAILNNPSTYEILDPGDFGLTRNVHIASRLTGWNAIKARVEQLNLSLTDEEVKEVTARIKAMADVRPTALDDTDSIIREFHLSKEMGVANSVSTGPGATDEAKILQDRYPQALVTLDNRDPRIWSQPQGHGCGRHVVVIGTQPCYTAKVCAEISQAFALGGRKQKLVTVTMCPGISVAQLEAWLPPETPIVRTMPNTPVSVQQGATALFSNRYATVDVVAEVQSILEHMSPVVAPLPREDLMDIAASVSGSAPAYIFHLMQSLVSAGSEHGLPEDIGHQLVVQSCLGAAALAQGAHGTPLPDLLSDVCVPGGSTEKAMRTLDRSNTSKAVRAAVEESWLANRAMGGNAAFAPS
ncbi:HMGL-like-domain-containing protein [Xylariaceae sp. FL0016]|nr:HMGL-like-domain-containing protein [Xylariaceae sp. FL0016]